ncbi:MAG: leucine-rich repeat domain-containing protein, partial [Erysipelotrichaceae bacterium]|nr:leucine-rich repeat domain-containing protein [Erysipelotrichaceae bacterium]
MEESILNQNSEEEEVLSTEVANDDLAESWTDEYGVKYSKDGKRLLKCDNRQINRYVVKSGTKVICKDAFKGCDLLREIELPCSLTSIGDKAFTTCGLQSLVIPNSVTNIGEEAFHGCKFKELDIPSSVINIGDGAFVHCDLQLTIHGNRFIEDGVCLIDATKQRLISFFKTGIKYYVVPDGVTAIGDLTFCDPIECVKIPASVKTISQDAFYYSNVICIILPHANTGVENLDIQGETPYFVIPACAKEEFEEIYYNKYPYYRGFESDKIIVASEEVLTTKADERELGERGDRDDDYVPYDMYWTDNYGCRYSLDGKKLIKGVNIQSYTVLEGTKVICDEAFRDCKSLQEIHLPSSLLSIGDSAFEGCSSLNQVVIPDSVTHIGE